MQRKVHDGEGQRIAVGVGRLERDENWRVLGGGDALRRGYRCAVVQFDCAQIAAVTLRAGDAQLIHGRATVVGPRVEGRAARAERVDGDTTRSVKLLGDTGVAVLVEVEGVALRDVPTVGRHQSRDAAGCAVAQGNVDQFQRAFVVDRAAGVGGAIAAEGDVLKLRGGTVVHVESAALLPGCAAAQRHLLECQLAGDDVEEAIRSGRRLLPLDHHQARRCRADGERAANVQIAGGGGVFVPRIGARQVVDARREHDGVGCPRRDALTGFVTGASARIGGDDGFAQRAEAVVGGAEILVGVHHNAIVVGRDRAPSIAREQQRQPNYANHADT